MKHFVKSELVTISKQILVEGKNCAQWAEIESSDMFQDGPYEGGYDADEESFCFSYYEDGQEYWFQITLEEAEAIAKHEKEAVEIRTADRSLLETVISRMLRLI